MVTGPSGVGKSTITQELHQRLGGDWLLWQSDVCSPRNHPISAEQAATLTHERALALDQRMFAANLAAVTAYLDHNWHVVSELSIMTPAEAEAVRKSNKARTMLVQLNCSPETLAEHLRERDTPVPDDVAIDIYRNWADVDLPDAVHIDVDSLTAAQVVNKILRVWAGPES